MEYQHTQHSAAAFRVAVLIVLAAVGVFVAAAGSSASLFVALLAVLLIGTTMTMFSRLTVAVTESEVSASFGWEWPRRVVSPGDVMSAASVRNRWWYGFGIRWFPGGTLWNVWGLDGVEFDLGDSRNLGFGTDEPDALLAALSSRVQSR